MASGTNAGTHTSPPGRKDIVVEMDTGTYNKDQTGYDELVKEMYRKNPPITLTPEYAEWITENQVRLLTRVSLFPS